jgi:hypothetical protein
MRLQSPTGTITLRPLLAPSISLARSLAQALVLEGGDGSPVGLRTPLAPGGGCGRGRCGWECGAADSAADAG